MGVRKRRRIPWGWIWLLFLVLMAGGYGAWQYRQNQENAGKLPQGVQTGRASQGDLDEKVTATGVVAAQTGAKVNIGSQITGRIRSLPADVGAIVKRGQVVAILDAPDLQAQVEQQRQSVAVAEANLEQTDSRLRQAALTAELSREQTRVQIEEAEHARRAAGENVRTAESASKMQPTQTSTEIARAEAALRTAQSQDRQVRETIELQLAQARTNIDDAKAANANAQAILRRQRTLLAEGFISRQEVETSLTAAQQAAAHLASAEANLNIVKQKTAADLQAARDQVSQADATVNAARAGRYQDAMRASEERNARENLRQSEATVKLRQSNRTQDLVRERAVEEARSAKAQAQSNLKQARALLRYQEAQLDKAIIRSPIDGTVLTVTTQQGETVVAGFQVQTLITVADLNRLEVRAYVDEVDVGRVRIGLPAEVRVETYPGRVFHGRVSKIAAASTVKDNVVTYETTVAITDTQSSLRPDMTADVTVLLGRTQNVLLIPTEAVHREVTRSLVYVLHREKQGKDRVETRTVTTGVQDGTSTQIISGLKDGEEVILAGLQRLGVKAVDAQDAEGKKESK